MHNLIDPYFTNDWQRLISRTVVFLNPFLNKRNVHSQSAKIEIAEKTWFRQAMKDTRSAVRSGQLNHLLCEEGEGMIVVIGRAKHSLQKFFGKNYL